MTPADFRAAFPAFADAKDPDIQRHINAAMVSPSFDAARWGAQLDEGLGCVVAHRLVVERAHNATANDISTRGDVVSQNVGGVATTRSVDILKAATGDPFLRTTYGQRYRYLSRQIGMGMVVA